MANWYDSIEKRWDGDDHYIAEEIVNGELRQVWATVIDDHEVCIVRHNENNNDVLISVDNWSRQTSLNEVDGLIRWRLEDY